MKADTFIFLTKEEEKRLSAQKTKSIRNVGWVKSVLLRNSNYFSLFVEKAEVIFAIEMRDNLP